jgi:4-diphosphocytidyl-2-C-methyl-D-erythritol kinase
VKRAAAAAKINLGLVVGPQRADGKHEVVTVYQRIALADRVTVERSNDIQVDGFREDTLVRRALTTLSEDGAAFSARIEKRIPVAAGLGGGSADAATALRLANELRDAPLQDEDLDALARGLGADDELIAAHGAAAPQARTASSARRT